MSQAQAQIGIIQPSTTSLVVSEWGTVCRASLMIMRMTAFVLGLAGALSAVALAQAFEQEGELRGTTLPCAGCAFEMATIG